ncbi:MAG: SpoIIE family protein phosphatase [Clostridia bacterium]|nr:SpoIIE family protein phosphatase [Clostridia bacterium]
MINEKKGQAAVLTKEGEGEEGKRKRTSGSSPKENGKSKEQESLCRWESEMDEGKAQEGLVLFTGRREERGQAPREREGFFTVLTKEYREREKKSAEFLLDILVGAMVCFLAQTHGLFGAYPFALGYLCAAPRRVFPALIGAGIGCYFLGPVGVLYICVYGAAVLFRLLLSYPYKKRLWHSAGVFQEEPALRVLLAASAGLGMAIYEFTVAGLATYTLLFALGAILLPALLAFFYIGVLDYGVSLGYLWGKNERREGAHASAVYFKISSLVLLYSVSLSLMKHEIFGISLGVCFGVLATLLVSRRFGALSGCVAGLGVGLAGALLYIPSYCLLGLLSGLLWQVSMPCALSAAVLAAGGFAVYTNGLSGFLAVVPEFSATALVFWPFLRRLPTEKGGVLEEEGAFAEGREPRGEEKTESVTDIEQTEESPSNRLSTALYKLSGMRDAMEEGTAEETYFLLAARIAAKHCGDCQKREACSMQKEKERALGVLAEQLRQGKELHQKAEEEEKESCPSFMEMTQELHTGVALLEQKKHRFPARALLLSDFGLLSRMLKELSHQSRYEHEENERDEMLLGQALADLGYQVHGLRVYGRRKKRIYIAHMDKGGRSVSAETLRQVCGEVCDGAFSMPTYIKQGKKKQIFLETEALYTVKSASIACPKRKGEVSGDVVHLFENQDGFYYALLCDGMGTGEQARRAAENCAYFLSELLMAGGKISSCMRLLNNFIRAGGEENAVAVDVCEIDLLLGTTTFLKSGAAPSFLKRGKSLFRIRSRTVPLGLFGAPDSERVNVETEVGDRIILFSDGIVQREEGDDLRGILLGENTTIQKQAADLLATAKGEDDKTVAVLEIVAKPA